jgi:hypothetical protein
MSYLHTTPYVIVSLVLGVINVITIIIITIIIIDFIPDPSPNASKSAAILATSA